MNILFGEQGGKKALALPSSVDPDAQKNAPANHWEMPGRLLGWFADVAIRPYLRPKLKFFPDNSGIYKTSREIFGDIWAVSAGLKNCRNKAEFRESGGILGEGGYPSEQKPAREPRAEGGC